MFKSLRPYQEQTICSVIDHMKNGNTKLLLNLATGLGKTKISTDLIERIGFKRTLFIADTEELIEQAGIAFLENKFNEDYAKNVEDYGFINWINDNKQDGNFKMGVVKSTTFKIDANVVVSSAQTLYRRLHLIPEDYFECIIVDECHKYMSRTYIMPLQFFKPNLLCGLSASPTRTDGLSLANVFEVTAATYDIAFGIKNGYLCELNGIRIKTDISLDSVRTTAGELNTKDLSTEVDIPKRNRLVVESYIKHAEGRQGLFFCVDVEHSVNLAEMFLEYGISCKPVVGNEEVTPERAQTIKDFKEGKIQVLTNVMVLTTGFNYSEVGCIGNVAPTKSLVKFIQSVGRGTRLKSKKYVDKFGQNCVVLDFVDSTSRHKLINCFELDKMKSLEDRVYITQETRDRILEERLKRAAHIENLHKKDEVIELIPLPDHIVFQGLKWKEAATEAQLQWIARLGHDIKNNVYTKEQCNQIIETLPARKDELEWLKKHNFETNCATIGNYKAARYKLEGNQWQKRK